MEGPAREYTTGTPIPDDALVVERGEDGEWPTWAIDTFVAQTLAPDLLAHKEGAKAMAAARLWATQIFDALYVWTAPFISTSPGGPAPPPDQLE